MLTVGTLRKSSARVATSHACAPRGARCCPAVMRVSALAQTSRRRPTCNAQAEQDAPAAIDVETSLLPITVVTGFLGSGKTTLINRILTRDHGKRIALIENEFGEVGIDSELIVAREALEGENEDVLLLENGCLCCTVRDDLVAAVNGLVQRGGFDHVVIETTGLANPAPIISTFLMEPSLRSTVRVDGICTVVDAAHVSSHLDRKEETGQDNEACAQLAYADRIILNKSDLVSAADMRALRERVTGINKLAAVIEATRSEVPVDYVLGIGGYALDTISSEVEREVAELAADAQAHGNGHSDGHGHSHDDHSHAHAAHAHGHSHDHEHSHSHSHDHSHADHGHSHGEGEEEHCDECGHSHAPGDHSHVHLDSVHDDAVKSASFVVSGAMDLNKLNLWLGALLQARGDDIYRMKGILNIQHNKERFVFQGVHQMFEGCPDREWEEGEERKSTMVFIGRDLDFDLLKEGFEDCIAEEEALAA